MANPRHACIIDLMLKRLKDASAAPNQIAVLCGYRAHLRVLRTLSSSAGVALAKTSRDLERYVYLFAGQ